MQQQEKHPQFKIFIDKINKNLISKDSSQLKTLIASIDSFEESFLNNYQKRKKEGVYYTVESISNFISHEALTLFIKAKLTNEISGMTNIQSLDQIIKLNPSIQQKIVEILLNITICDPACGSGVFLLASANLIYSILEKLNPDLNKIKIKQQLLKNLYGYDINENAINLSILKLFRWIYDNECIDYSEILANLRSNFLSLNSLMQPKLKTYDLIIGNPPYGNILDSYEKKTLKAEQISYNDIYCSFLLKALNWTKGIIGFLVPKSFLLRQGYIEFRNQLLSKANILKIVDIGSKLFKNATNEVLIIIYEKKRESSTPDLKVFDFPNTEIITYPNQNVDTLKICVNNACPLCIKSKKLYIYTFQSKCPYCNSETVGLNRIRIKPNPFIYEIINDIEMNGDFNYLNPIDFPKMIRGEEDQGLKMIRKNLKHDLTGSCFFLNARNDFSYYSFSPRKSITFEELNSKILKGNNFEYYTSPKLLIKHNNIIPEAIYTKKNVCFTSSIYSLLHEDLEELKYLCAILNSSLMQFYCIYGINNQKDTTINLNQYMIRHLPILKPDEPLKLELAKKVDIIINFFETNNGAINQKISEILKQIDDSIFNLYFISEKNKEVIKSEIKKYIKFYAEIYK
ncbi:MAG: Eco57I restriction-modification methylase domain-containing protein [Promethearchaeota archaeon]